MARQRVLIVAYHYPPFKGSTGAIRTLAFSRYLRDNGWDVCVLTIRSEVYEDASDENESLIPPHVRVERAWGLDTRRSLSVFGRYPTLLSLPDRWQSWILGGFLKGSSIVKEWAPDVLMSTYPIASAHLVAYLLKSRFRLPWVAEFRDPMLQENYPSSSAERWAFSKVESLVFANAQRVVVTTDGCKRMYQRRYADWRAEGIRTISNGYDPVAFSRSENASPKRTTDQLVLLHSGLLYPHERNPSEFFRAVRSLAERGFFEKNDIRFHFRASGNETAYQETIEKLGIDDYVKFLPRIAYLKAVEEIRSADALMIFQAANCNDQIPAKVYECFYARKPLLAFTDPQGETGRLLESVGIDNVARLDDSTDIALQITLFVAQLRKKNAFVVPEAIAKRFSRESLTVDLSTVLKEALLNDDSSRA